MITGEEFRLFRNLIYEESGIYLKENRKDFLEHRMAKRMKAINIRSPYWYYRHLVEKRTKELMIFIDLLTINETSFFRNVPQFEFFKDKVLPEITRGKESDINRKLRVWSAGCSTGEEPYSIAMGILETIPGGAWGDIRVFASDISLTALKTADRAVYEKRKIIANVEARYINRYFSDMDGHYRVKDEVKRLVVFDYHNLKHENGLRDLDVIFCRNVMIYFDADEQSRLIGKFYESLRPGGYLLLGHAESLQGLHTGFEFVYQNKGTGYQKPKEV